MASSSVTSIMGDALPSFVLHGCCGELHGFSLYRVAFFSLFYYRNLP
jgi:hypothetical protein